jgi:hypothetical protein
MLQRGREIEFEDRQYPLAELSGDSLHKGIFLLGEVACEQLSIFVTQTCDRMRRMALPPLLNIPSQPTHPQ